MIFMGYSIVLPKKQGEQEVKRKKDSSSFEGGKITTKFSKRK
jgi:hypothetical protein